MLSNVVPLFGAVCKRLQPPCWRRFLAVVQMVCSSNDNYVGVSCAGYRLDVYICRSQGLTVMEGLANHLRGHQAWLQTCWAATQRMHKGHEPFDTHVA
jgi:hypothetical protein